MSYRLERIPNLTSLRFFLALLVVIFHTFEFFQKRGFPYYDGLPIFHKGAEAVYVFFSLSGFLIIRQLFIEKKAIGSINLKAFYLRRILRIFPLYYLILAFGFLYYRFILPYFGFEFENNYDFMHGLLMGITFFPNILATLSPGGILEVLWSIGIEEQFYLLIAPAFLWISEKKIIIFLSVFTILYIALYTIEELDFLYRYNMLFFYFSFSGLCSIIIYNSYFNQILQKFRYLIMICFIVHLTTNFFLISNSIVYHIFNMILFGLTVSAFSLKPTKLLENKGLDYLGKISYGIYMYHAIVVQLIGLVYMKFISKLNLGYLIDVVAINSIIIILTIVISHFSYRYYESYFLNKKYKSSSAS